MKIELTHTEAKYLVLKALGIAAVLKSRAGFQVLQTEAEIIIHGPLEESAGRCEESLGESSAEGLSV